MSHQNSVWKALHWQPPTPQRDSHPPGAADRGQYLAPRDPLSKFPEDRPEISRLRQSGGQFNELYEAPSLLSRTQGYKLEPLSDSPPRALRPVEFPAVDRPNQVQLDPVAPGATGVSKEVAARLLSRMSALELRTTSVEDAANQAINATRPAVERMEDRVAKMTGSLSQAEAEVGALRRVVVEQEQQRRALEAKLQDAVDANGAARLELQEQRQRLEQAGREAGEMKTRMRQLEDSVSRDSSSVVQEQELRRQQQEMRFREEAQRRESSVSQQISAMKQEMEVLRSALSASRSEAASSFQQLVSRMDGSDRQLGGLVRSESSGTLSQLKNEVAELRSTVGQLQSSMLEADKQIKKDEQRSALTSSELQSKIVAAESNVLSQAASLVENRTREMQRRWNELEDTMYERLNSRLSEESQKLSHVTKTNTRDKQHQQERVADLERHINTLSERQDEGDESVRKLMKKTREDFMTLANHNKKQLEEMAGKLQDQTAEALATLRSYTRDMEEEQERSRLGLEGVVRMEIKSRMSATNKVKDAVNKVKAEVRSEVKSLRSESDERARKLEQKLAVLLAAERKLYSRQTDLEAINSDQVTALEAKVDAMKEELEEMSVNQVLNESVLKEDMRAELDGGYDALSDTLIKEIRIEIQAAQESSEASLTQALATVDEDVAGIHQDLQKQLTDLSQLRADDLTLIQEVADKSMKRCDEVETIATTIQQELDEVTEAVTAAMEKQAGDLTQLENQHDETLRARLAAMEEELAKVHAELSDLHEGTAGSASEIDALRKEIEDQFSDAKAQVETAHEILKVQVEAKYEAQAASWTDELRAVEQKLDDALAAAQETAVQAKSETPRATAAPGLEDRVAGLEVDLVLAAELNNAETGALSDAMMALSGAVSDIDARVANNTDQLRWQLDEVQRGVISRSEVSQKASEGHWLQELKRLDARLDSLTGTLAEVRTTQEVDLKVLKDSVQRSEEKASKEVSDIRKRQEDLVDAGMKMEERFGALEAATKERIHDAEVESKLSEEILRAELGGDGKALPIPTDDWRPVLDERLAALSVQVDAAQEALKVQMEVSQQAKADSWMQELKDTEARLVKAMGASSGAAEGPEAVMQLVDSAAEGAKLADEALKHQVDQLEHQLGETLEQVQSLVSMVAATDEVAHAAQERVEALEEHLQGLEEEVQDAVVGQVLDEAVHLYEEHGEGLKGSASGADPLRSEVAALSSKVEDAAKLAHSAMEHLEQLAEQITPDEQRDAQGESGALLAKESESMAEWIDAIRRDAKMAEEALMAKLAETDGASEERLHIMEGMIETCQQEISALGKESESLVDWVEGIHKDAKQVEEELGPKVESALLIAEGLEAKILTLEAELQDAVVDQVLSEAVDEGANGSPRAPADSGVVPEAASRDISAKVSQALAAAQEAQSQVKELGEQIRAGVPAEPRGAALLELVEGVREEAKGAEDKLTARIASSDEAVAAIQQRLALAEQSLEGFRAQLPAPGSDNQAAAAEAAASLSGDALVEWVEGIWKEAKAAEEALASKIAATDELVRASQLEVKEVKELAAKLEAMGQPSPQDAAPASGSMAAEERESIVEWVEGIWKEAKAEKEALVERVKAIDEIARAAQEQVQALEANLQEAKQSASRAATPSIADRPSEKAPGGDVLDTVAQIQKEAKAAEQALSAKVAATEKLMEASQLRIQELEGKLQAGGLAADGQGSVEAAAAAEKESLVQWVEGIWKEAKAAEESLVAKIASTDAAVQGALTQVGDLNKRMEAQTEQLALVKGSSDDLLKAFASSTSQAPQADIQPSEMLEAIDEVREVVLQVQSTSVTTQQLQQQIKDALAAAGEAAGVATPSHLLETDMATVKDTILEQQAMLLKHEDMLSSSGLRQDDVQQLVIEALNAEKVVNHTQALELIDDVREEIMAEIDKNQDLQSEMLSEMVETLRAYEDRLVNIEDPGARLHSASDGASLGYGLDAASDGASLGYGLDAASDGASLGYGLDAASDGASLAQQDAADDDESHQADDQAEEQQALGGGQPPEEAGDEARES